MKKTLFILCTLLCSLEMWAQSLETITSFTFTQSGGSVPSGWEGTGTKLTTQGDFLYLCSNGSLASPSINFENYSSIKITITVGRYGSLSGSKATVAAKVGSTQLGTVDGTSTTPSNQIINVTTMPKGSNSIVFTCTNATSTNHGARITAIKIEGAPKNSGSSTQTYNVTIANNITGGTVSADATTAAEGATITLSATPNDGYAFSSWNVANASTSDAITVKDNKFTMPAANVNVSATFTPIEDVPTGKVTYFITDLDKILPTDDVIISWKKVGDGTNGNTYAITNDKGTSSAPTAEQMLNIINGAYATESTNIVWNITRSEKDGTFTIYPYGITTKYLYCTNTNDGVRVGTGQAKTFQIKDNYLYENGTTNARYLGIYNSTDVRCYTSINSNIKDQELAFYVNKNIINIGSTGYATYVTPKALDFTGSDVTAYVVSSVSNSTLTLTEATKVPAGQAIIVKGNEGANKVSVIKTADAVTNKMESAAEDIVVANDPDNIYYILANGSNGVGFYKAKGTIAAGKGYIKVPVSSDAKASLSFNFGTPTGINATENVKGSNVVYNLNGQRVSNNAKGIVIINGKKFINK